MNIRIPWIISRRRKIIAIILDCFISSLLYNFIFFFEFNSYPNRLVTTSFVFFWVIASYILGRYSSVYKLSSAFILKELIKSFILIIVCNLIYLTINWGYPLLFFWNTGNFYNLELRELSNFFIRITIYLASTSFIFQSILKLLTNNIIDQKKAGSFMALKRNLTKFQVKFHLIKRKLS